MPATSLGEAVVSIDTGDRLFASTLLIRSDSMPRTLWYAVRPDYNFIQSLRSTNHNTWQKIDSGVSPAQQQFKRNESPSSHLKYNVLASFVQGTVESFSDTEAVFENGCVEQRILASQKTAAFTSKFNFINMAQEKLHTKINDLNSIIHANNENVEAVSIVETSAFLKPLKYSKSFYISQTSEGLAAVAVGGDNHVVATKFKFLSQILHVIEVIILKIVKFFKKVIDWFKVFLLVKFKHVFNWDDILNAQKVFSYTLGMFPDLLEISLEYTAKKFNAEKSGKSTDFFEQAANATVQLAQTEFSKPNNVLSNSAEADSEWDYDRLDNGHRYLMNVIVSNNAVVAQTIPEPRAEDFENDLEMKAEDFQAFTDMKSTFPDELMKSPDIIGFSQRQPGNCQGLRREILSIHGKSRTAHHSEFRRNHSNTH